MHVPIKSSTFALAFENKPENEENETLRLSLIYRGVEQLVARQAHNLEVTRSSRVSATMKEYRLRYSFFFMCVPVNNDCHTCLQMEATLHKKKAWFPHVSADGSHTP